MSNFSNRMAQFMMGRRGRDEFGTFLIILAFAVCIIYMISHIGILYYISIIILIYQLVRSMSRNIPKRYQENQRFLREWNKIRHPKAAKAQKKQQHQQQKQTYRTAGDTTVYRFFNCPSCGLKMRAPNGKGKIRVTCSRCGKQFETLV